MCERLNFEYFCDIECENLELSTLPFDQKISWAEFKGKLVGSNAEKILKFFPILNTLIVHFIVMHLFWFIYVYKINSFLSNGYFWTKNESKWFVERNVCVRIQVFSYLLLSGQASHAEMQVPLLAISFRFKPPLLRNLKRMSSFLVLPKNSSIFTQTRSLCCISISCFMNFVIVWPIFPLKKFRILQSSDIKILREEIGKI